MKKLIKILENWEDYLDRFIFPLIIANVVLGIFFFRLWAWLVGFLVAVGVILAPFVQVLREERNTFMKSLRKLPVILWCAVMFASVGTIGLPFVVKYTALVICPPGYQKITPHVATSVKKSPGKIEQSASMQPICIGEDGYFIPNQFHFLAITFCAFLVLALALNLIAIAVDSFLEKNQLQKRGRYIAIPLIFFLFLFLIKSDTLYMPTISKSINKMLYTNPDARLKNPRGK